MLNYLFLLFSTMISEKEQKKLQKHREEVFRRQKEIEAKYTPLIRYLQEKKLKIKEAVFYDRRVAYFRSINIVLTQGDVFRALVK